MEGRGCEMLLQPLLTNATFTTLSERITYWNANIGCVGDVLSLVGSPAIVTVGFMISEANHVRFRGGDGGHLVLELVQNRFIHLVSICDGGVWFEA